MDIPEAWAERMDLSDDAVQALWASIGEANQAGLASYVVDGILPGGFLTAVLCNDLADAIGRADAWNRSRLPEIVTFLYNCAPATCWGSAKRVGEWKGLSG